MADDNFPWIHGVPKECSYSYYSSGIDRASHYIVTRRDLVPCSNYQALIDTAREKIKDTRERYVEKNFFQIKIFEVSYGKEIKVKIEPNNDDNQHNFELFNAKF